MSVTLAPRTIREWGQAYHILSPAKPQSILDICHQMEREVGPHDDGANKGQIDPLMASIDTLYAEYGAEDDRAGNYYIKEGKDQQFANRYREFEKRFKILKKQYEGICDYLEKAKNRNSEIDGNIARIWGYLAFRMIDIERERAKFLILFQQINFQTYNRIFQAAKTVFFSGPLRMASDWLQTKTIETLAVGAFVGVIGYSVATNANASFLSGVTTLAIKGLSPLFFMYIGYIFSKTFRSNGHEALGQEIVIRQVTPPGSPARQ